MLKVLFVLGTRPEAIKLAPVIKELGKTPECFSARVCVTAQHREMLDQVLRLFEIVPDHDLSIMEKNQSLFEVTTKGLSSLQWVLEKERPDVVLVQGDTTTAFVGALAAFYLKIPVGHVEAGLRTNDKYHPFPEEVNRRLTSQLVDFHFAPTKMAQGHLLLEGVASEKVWVTGNTVIDALLAVAQQVSAPSEENKWRQYFSQQFSLVLDDRPIILVTGHRRESFGKGFEDICGALQQIALSYPNISIIYPVHLNPHVQEPVRKILGGISNVFLLPPLDYAPFVYLMQRCHLILTDSGGIQEEAPSLNKPLLVMREITERPEAMITGAARLVGTDPTKILSGVKELLSEPRIYQQMATAANPYGDGKAALRIATALSQIKLQSKIENACNHDAANAK
jgi:UDP-N-acetylglucosamine 2-epimerase (non-hydrolysing)